MRAILRDASVTDEELQTAMVEAEGQINSRPITYVSSDANDLTPLTPNHFIVGQLRGQYAPEAFDVEENQNPRKRWCRVRQLLGQFWARWRKEFLPNLNKRWEIASSSKKYESRRRGFAHGTQNQARRAAFGTHYGGSSRERWLSSCGKGQSRQECL